jgi:hypothetical protein
MMPQAELGGLPPSTKVRNIIEGCSIEEREKYSEISATISHTSFY